MTVELNRNASEGYRLLMGETRTDDFDDPWATALDWLFAVANVTYVRFGERLPEYAPSPILSVATIEDSHAGCMVLDLLDDGDITEDDLRAVYVVLSRYAEWLKVAGRDY